MLANEPHIYVPSLLHSFPDSQRRPGFGFGRRRRDRGEPLALVPNSARFVGFAVIRRYRAIPGSFKSELLALALLVLHDSQYRRGEEDLGPKDEDGEEV